MVGGVVQLHVHFDFPVGTRKADVLEVTLAELDDFGVWGNQSTEVDGNIIAHLLLLQGRKEEKGEIVLGVETEVVEKCQLLVFDQGKVEGAAIDIDVGVDGVFARVLEDCGLKENAGAVGGLHVVPQLAKQLFLPGRDCIHVHRLETGDDFMP